LCILQLNIRKLHIAQSALLNTARPEDWDVMALQEPYLDHLGNTRVSLFWTVRYPPSHLRDSSTRTQSILLIDTNTATDAYTYLDIPSPDITAVRFNGQFGHLLVCNIYNDCTHNNSM
ncbi:hypothetical protein B0H34DRAFT_640256, partial [Crassisporium funariophilum]